MQQKRNSRRRTAQIRSRSLDGFVGIILLTILCGQIGIPGLGHAGHLFSALLFAAGYLGTCAVTRVYDKSDGFGATDFFKQLWYRLRHVWPTMLAVVAFTTVVCTVLDGSLLAPIRADLFPALGFFSNWTDLLHNAAPGTSPSPLGGFWLMGVEAQLFVAWLAALTFLLRLDRTLARHISIALAGLTGAWLLAQSFLLGASLERVSLSTDMRACSYLLGSWLAFAFPLGRVPVIGKDLLLRPMGGRKRHMRGRRYQATTLAHALGIVSFVCMMGLALLIPSTGTRTHGILIIAISVLCIPLMTSLLAPGSVLGRLFSFPPFAWLGSRALCIYLWSYPIRQLILARMDPAPWYVLVAGIAATLAIAEITYRLVEIPFASNRTLSESRSNVAPYRLATTGLVLVIAAGFGGRALLTIPSEAVRAATSNEATSSSNQTMSTSATSSPTSKDTSKDTSTQVDNADSADTNTNESENASQDNKTSSASSKGSTSSKKTSTVDESTIINAPASETRAGLYDPVLIGDSVPGDADWSRLPDALIDTYIGRRPDQALEVIRGYLAQDAVGSIVILACFSNVAPTADQLDAFAEALGDDRQIYLVGTVNPDGFMDQANGELQSAIKRHSNMHYIDWPSIEEGHEKEYLWDDATHLRPEGGVVYVQMVIEAIAQDLIDAGGTTK